MTLVAGLLGALFAVGAVTFAVALRPVEPGEIPARKRAVPTSGSARDQLLIQFVAGAGAAILAGAITRWPMAALLLGIAGFLAPRMLGGGAVRQARLDRMEAIATWAEMLRDTMAGAGGLEQSMIATAAIAPLPIRSQVVRLAAMLERQQLATALQAFADDLDDPAGDLVVAALLLAADKSPKRLGELLGRLAQSARAEVNMRLRVEASRSRTRTAVRVIIMFTLGFAAFLLLFNREYLDPYDSLLGQIILGVIGLCFGAAFYWLSRASQFDEDERFLRTELFEGVG
ncbi:MAG: type II secretion system F family protein [Acidimicrobiales bacterium]